MNIYLVTVTLNSEKELSHCIESVQKQTYTNIEHIMIDGNSSESTVSVIKKYQAKIAHGISEPDRGMYDLLIKE